MIGEKREGKEKTIVFYGNPAISLVNTSAVSNLAAS